MRKPAKAEIMREVKDYIYITLGLISYALGWAAFLLPYQITTSLSYKPLLIRRNINGQGVLPVSGLSSITQRDFLSSGRTSSSMRF